MEFLQARSGRCNCEEDQEEDQEVIIGNMGKLPFSSSSSSSPSSSHYKGFFPHHHELSQRWGAQIYESASSCDPADPLNFGINSIKKPDHELIDLSTTSATNTTTNSHTRVESDGDIGGAVCIEREHMFDKVVTPSDVGKLNRLVIPKQQAEKYFPLDSTSNEKGLLLNFEDRSGKPWRFRYSYWNSSQSYVMTKGWSRFVKEKKLYAGDIVSFERGAGELGKDRLYIDWKRRPDRISGTLPPLHHHHQPIPLGRFFFPATVPVPYRQQQQLQQQTSGTYCGYNGYNLVNQGSGGPVLYLGSSTGVVQQQEGGHKQVPIVFESVPVVHGKAAAAKTLRLFGVNMECPISEDEVLSSTTIPHTTMASSHHHHQIISSNSLAHHHHPLQLRLYNGAPVQAAAATVSEATHIDQLPRINREPSMSLDLDI